MDGMSDTSLTDRDVPSHSYLINRDTTVTSLNNRDKKLKSLTDRDTELVKYTPSTGQGEQGGRCLTPTHSDASHWQIGNTHIDIPQWIQMDAETNLKDMMQDEQLLVSNLNFSALHYRANNFRAGSLTHYIANWECLTSDREIIPIIKYGLKLKIVDYIHPREGIQYHHSQKEHQVIDRELPKMLQKGIITKTSHNTGDYFSPIFMREKSNGKCRIILNLKQLNKNIDTKHFKMESIRNVKHMIRRNCWMASVDLKDAYYSIHIHPKHCKFLKFLWEGSFYGYTCLPNGYSDAMRIFKKVLKPVYGFLRMRGFQSVTYVDDNFLQGDVWQDCQDNINATTNVLTCLGYTIHMEKSILEPRQEIEFLGFVVNSIHMTIALTYKKKDKIKTLCTKVLDDPEPTIRLVAKLIGNLVATEEAFPLAPFHYRPIEMNKIEALEQCNGDYDRPMTLNREAHEQILWWSTHIIELVSPIRIPRVDMIIHTDASEQGWGAVFNGVTANGRWTEEDLTPMNINFLEIMAAKFAILSFCKEYTPKHIRIMTDNTTTESHINHQGGTSSPRCNAVAREIWEWAEHHDVWLSAAYIPGTLNIDADEQSREFDDATEWSISDFIFNEIVQMWGAPDIDLFASRINTKTPSYISWKPDPNSVAINAFTVPWDYSLIYCFPPFSIIWRMLEKIRRDQAEALVVVPLWPTQSWFPCLMSMITDHPMVFSAIHLLLPNKPKAKHPLHYKLKLAAMRLSGDPSQNMTFVRMLKTSSWHHGGHRHERDMHQQLKNGFRFLSQKTLIPFIHL